MKIAMICVFFGLATTTGFAQGADPMSMALASGYCANTGVRSAAYLPSGMLQVTCNRRPVFQRPLFHRPVLKGSAPAGAEPTNIVPLIGALGPTLFGVGAAGAGLLAIAGGNSSTSDTQ